ncbi:MAG: ABC transporter permease, partial [Lachnospiraceae bacterium]
FKAKLGISEIIVTIMLNYISINFLGLAVRSFLMDPAGSVPQSAKIAADTVLPKIVPRTRLHIGFIIAIVAAIIVWLIMEKTTVGYEIKVVGFNKRAAKCNGISVMKNIILSAFISGGLAGMAGVIEVLAIQKKLLEGISSNCGYTAVLIALIASNHPLGVVGAAIGFAAMQVGANSIQRQLGIPSAIVNILVGLVVLLILMRTIFTKKQKKAVVVE